MISVEINGLTWVIEFVGTDHEALKSAETMYLGITHYRTCHIYIDKSMPIALMRRTVAHELTHAYWIAHGYSGKYKFTDEEMIHFLVSFAEQIFRDTDSVMAQYHKDYDGMTSDEAAKIIEEEKL